MVNNLTYTCTATNTEYQNTVFNRESVVFFSCVCVCVCVYDSAHTPFALITVSETHQKRQCFIFPVFQMCQKIELKKALISLVQKTLLYLQVTFVTLPQHNTSY